mgnify:CR=1 FL=1
MNKKLRKVMVEDIIIKDTKSIGKIDIYIDISGSMSGNCGVKDKDGNNRSSYDINADTIAVTTWSLSKSAPESFDRIKDWHMDDVQVPF